MIRTTGRVRHRVEAPGMPWVALAESAGRQPPAAYGTVSMQRLHGVFGTGRHEPAPRPEQRTQEVAVDPEQSDCDAYHAATSSSRVQTSLAAWSTPAPGFPRNRTTTCRPGNRASRSRNRPRIQRLKRFRSTALRRALRPTMNPSMPIDAAGLQRTWMEQSGVDHRVRLARTLRNSCSPSRRCGRASIETLHTHSARPRISRLPAGLRRGCPPCRQASA